MDTINPHATIDNLSEQFAKQRADKKLNPYSTATFGLPPRLEIATRVLTALISHYGVDIKEDYAFDVADVMLEKFNNEIK